MTPTHTLARSRALPSRDIHAHLYSWQGVIGYNSSGYFTRRAPRAAHYARTYATNSFVCTILSYLYAFQPDRCGPARSRPRSAIAESCSLSCSLSLCAPLLRSSRRSEYRLVLMLENLSCPRLRVSRFYFSYLRLKSRKTRNVRIKAYSEHTVSPTR